MKICNHLLHIHRSWVVHIRQLRATYYEQVTASRMWAGSGGNMPAMRFLAAERIIGFNEN